MTQKATFTFHGRLNFFLPRHRQHITFTHRFDWKASIKDMIESLGPPHPEIELITVNAQSVDFDYIVQPGDDIAVYDDFNAISLTQKERLIPPYPGRPRFILDTHLGRLASYLRMMGFDTLYRNDYPDDELAQVSHEEQRILLTRDIGVLKRGIVVYGYYVRNTKPRLRLQEITQRYDLIPHMKPFKHCMRCNGLLARVDKDAIRHKIEEDTAAIFEVFHQCQDCEQVYWKGSHYQKMERLLSDISDA